MIDCHFLTPLTPESDHQESDTDRQGSSFGPRKVTTQEPEKAISVSSQPSYGTDYYSHTDEPEWKPSVLISGRLPFPTTVPDEYRIREIDRKLYEIPLEPNKYIFPSIPGCWIRYCHDAYHEFAMGYVPKANVTGVTLNGEKYSTDCREIKKLLALAYPEYDLQTGCMMSGELTDGSVFYFFGVYDGDCADIHNIIMEVAPAWKTLIDYLEDDQLIRVACSMSANNSGRVNALINPDKSGQLSGLLEDLGAGTYDWVKNNQREIARVRSNLKLLLD